MTALRIAGAIAFYALVGYVALLAFRSRKLKTDADLRTYRDPRGTPYGRTDRTLW